MAAKRILLFGASGQLGSAFIEAWRGPDELLPLTRSEADLAIAGQAASVITRLRPDAVINAAAYTAVDKAESEPELAQRINAEAVYEMAQACAELNVPLVHYSTDYVFDGRKPEPYTETDPPAPLSMYGRSKLAGEQAAASCSKHLVLRTSWVFGPHGGNFLRTILRLAEERESLDVVADQIGAPTSTAAIVHATRAALSQLLTAGSDDSRWGVYHLTSAGAVSWCDFARWIVHVAGQTGASLRLTESTIHAIASSAYVTAAERPLNSRLDCSKFQATFDYALPTWQDAVAPVLARLISLPSFPKD
jgi:dTDP-4-dehydrorhamnose reductase